LAIEEAKASGFPYSSPTPSFAPALLTMPSILPKVFRDFSIADWQSSFEKSLV
jgi:hypothetical protein